MLVRIIPIGDPFVLREFLNKHGFNVGELKNGSSYELMLSAGPPNIDTRFFLDRLADMPKVSKDFEFRVEDFDHDC